MLPITSQPSARIPDEFLDGPRETNRGFRRRGNAVAGVAVDNVAAVTNSSIERPDTCGCCYEFRQKHFTAAGIERKGPEKTKTDGQVGGLICAEVCCAAPTLVYLSVDALVQGCLFNAIKSNAAILGPSIVGSVLGCMCLAGACGTYVAKASYRHVAHALDVRGEAETKEEEAEKGDVVKDGLKGAFNASGQKKIKEADETADKAKEGNNARGRLCFTKGDGTDLTLELLALEPEEDTSKKLGMVKDKAPQLKRETDDDYN